MGIKYTIKKVKVCDVEYENEKYYGSAYEEDDYEYDMYFDENEANKELEYIKFLHKKDDTCYFYIEKLEY